MRYLIFWLSVSFFVSGCNGAYSFSTLDTPGFYKLAANVSNQITISTSNITLDMNGHVVSGGTNGIVINNNLNNVTIKNGTIRSVTSDGVQVNPGCQDISLSRLSIDNALRGISLDQVTNGIIKNCDLNLNTTGIEIDTCQNILLENCTAQANIQAGYCLLSSTTCSLFDCKALSTGRGNSNSSGDESYVYGYVARDGYGHIFERCIANSTQNLNATDWDTIIAGFSLIGTGTLCHKIIDCEAGNSMSNADGNTIPHGIYLRGTLDSLTTSNIIGQQGVALDYGHGGTWSPDGKYFVIPFNQSLSSATGSLQLFRYDPLEENVLLVDGFTLDKQGFVSRWHPDGNYVAVGDGDNSSGAIPCRIRLYQLDRINEVLKLVDLQDWDTATFDLQAVTALSWTDDGRFLAVAGENSGTAPRYNIKIYEFDKVTETLTELDQVTFNDAPAGDDIFDIAWTHDGNYFTVVGDPESGVTAGTYQFNKALKFVDDATLITMSTDPGGGIESAGCDWSYDDKYIAVVSALNNSANTRIYRFDGSSFTLVDSTDNSATLSAGQSGPRGAKIRWSPDGRYVAVSGTGSTDGHIVKLYWFDRDSETLQLIDTFNNGATFRTTWIDWAPDGGALLISTELTSGSIARIFKGIVFPVGNVITNNKVYCNSNGTLGYGISGSSISNHIIENSSSNNPYSYVFVTNVFNQLFGEGPSLLQDIGLDPKEPICYPDDMPTRIKRTERLLESLIDNLL